MSPTSREATGSQGQARSPSLRLAARRARGYRLNQPRDVWEAIELFRRFTIFIAILAILALALGGAFFATRAYLAGVFRERLAAAPEVSQRIGAVTDASVELSQYAPLCAGGDCRGVERFVSRLHGASGDLMASLDYNISSGGLKLLALCKPDGALVWKSEEMKLIQNMDCR